jgi:predicted nucleic acid-binding Zn ribbon protein
MTEKRVRPNAPVAVGEALRGYLARTGLATRLAQAQTVTDWPALVGSQIAAVTQPESVAPDGTLFVRVATSAWMNELQLMMPEIMARLNAGRAGGRVKTIRWLLAR